MIKRSFTIPREKCCCDDMFNAVSSENKVSINVKESKTCNMHESYVFMMPFVDTYNASVECELLGEVVGDDMLYCPFCGKYIFPCDIDRSREWEKRKYLCEDFLEWFMKGDINDKYEKVKAPTNMFKFEPKENKFYMHYRKGFGEGWIPVKYCIYCGEPLSEMVEKHGLSKFIADQLDPSEWQGKYKLCKGQKKLREHLNWPNFYT